MNKYELALVVTAKVDDETRAAVVEKAKGYIARYGGEISNIEEWGKRRLAYEIAHEREGFYYFIHFDAEGNAPAQIENEVRIMDNVLRFLIVCDDGRSVIVTRRREEEPVEEKVEAAVEAVAEAVEEEVKSLEETVEEVAEVIDQVVEELKETEGGEE